MRVPLAVLGILLVGCRSRGSGAGAPGAGDLSVEWTGGTHASFRAPATARWCESDRLLEIIATRNDTAVGLAIETPDSLRPQSYPVRPSRPAPPSRPNGGVALRWLAEFDLRAYDGQSGEITLTQGNARSATGRFTAVVKAQAGNDTVKVSGSFSQLGIATAKPPCGRANRAGG